MWEDFKNLVCSVNTCAGFNAGVILCGVAASLTGNKMVAGDFGTFVIIGSGCMLFLSVAWYVIGVYWFEKGEDANTTN